MKNKKIKIRIITEIIIRLLFFVTMPAAFSSGFLGIKLMFSAIGTGEPIKVDSMWVLILLVCFTIMFGRFFCGFVCAFGTLGDAVYPVRQRSGATAKADGQDKRAVCKAEQA